MVVGEHARDLRKEATLRRIPTMRTRATFFSNTAEEDTQSERGDFPRWKTGQAKTDTLAVHERGWKR